MIKLPWSTVTEPGDPQALNAQAVQENLDALARASIGTGNRQLQIRSGVGLVTFAASASSAVTVVAHGLGHTPACVIVSSAGGTGVEFTAPLSDWDTADFKVEGLSGPGPLTGDVNFAWIALG